MNTIEFIKQNLESSTGWAMGLINDMRDTPLTQPTAAGGNHPLWVLGHITYAESNLLDGFILGQSNRFPELKEQFDQGSTPTADADAYPSMDDLMGKFETIRAATLAHLATLSESDLDKSTTAPEELKQFFGTVGACFSAMAVHIAFHAGQVADARRAAGKGPMMG